jgi:DnaK suppressor protein
MLAVAVAMAERQELGQARRFVPAALIFLQASPEARSELAIAAGLRFSSPLCPRLVYNPNEMGAETQPSESTALDLTQVRARLEAKLAQVRAEWQALANDDLEAMRSRAQMQYGKRIGDHTSDALEHTRKVGAAESLERLEREARAALERIESGTYGRCQGCGQPIARPRLEALPWARQCVECQAKEERRERPRRGRR